MSGIVFCRQVWRQKANAILYKNLLNNFGISSPFRNFSTNWISKYFTTAVSFVEDREVIAGMGFVSFLSSDTS